MSDLSGRWSLVTGASSGLGRDFAELLAERRSPVVLVARREDRLRKLAGELEGRHGVRTHVVPLDLAASGAARALYEQVQSAGIAVDLLVNNAGFGLFGPFFELSAERQTEMLELDVVSLTELTRLFGADMVARNFGYILLLSSIGAYQPSPGYAAYSAAKSYVLNFGEALSYELRRTNVKVSVLSPGITKTEFLEVSGQEPTLYQRLAMMPSRKVAEIGLRALLRGKPSTVPGLANALTVQSLRLVPRRTAAALANLLMSSR